MITLALPFPVSTNAIWRSGRHPKTGKVCVFRQRRYLEWRNAATGYFYEQGGPRLPKINGHFRTHIILSDRRRGNRDGDNFCKSVLDFCQHAGLIANDKLSDRTTVEWGHVEAPAGCIVTLSPVE